MNDRNDRAYEGSYAERYQQLLECYNRASEWQRWQVEGLPRGDGGKVFPHQEEMRRALELLEWVRNTPARDFGVQVVGAVMMSHVAALCLLKELQLRGTPDRELSKDVGEWIDYELRMLEPCEGPAADCLRARALGARALAADLGEGQVDRLTLVSDAMDACIPALESGRDEAFFLVVELIMQHGAAILRHSDAADTTSRVGAIKLLQNALSYCNDVDRVDWVQRCERYGLLLMAFGHLSLDEPDEALEAVGKSLRFAERANNDRSGRSGALQADIACAHAVMSVVLSLLGVHDEAGDTCELGIDALDDNTAEVVEAAVFDRLCCCMRALGTAMEGAEFGRGIDILTRGVARADAEMYDMVKRSYRRFPSEHLDPHRFGHNPQKYALMGMAYEYKRLHQRYAPRVHSFASLHEDPDFARWLEEV